MSRKYEGIHVLIFILATFCAYYAVKNWQNGHYLLAAIEGVLSVWNIVNVLNSLTEDGKEPDEEA